MLDPQATHEAAQTLWNAWRDAGVMVALPLACRPVTRAEAYAVQSALLELAGGNAPAWKIAATSQAGQQHIGVDGPLAGRIFADGIRAPGGLVSLAGNRMRVAEIEFAFRIGRTLAPRNSEWRCGEVVEAVDALLPSIEIPDSRFTEYDKAGAAQLIADNACAWRFVPGLPAPDSWRDIDLAEHPVQAAVGRRYLRDGVGRNVLGDPRLALTWLVNELSAHGIALEAGQIVTTGACMKPLEIEPGDHLFADFGVLGIVDVRFSD